LSDHLPPESVITFDRNAQPPQKMPPIFAAKPVLKPARHRKAPRTVPRRPEPPRPSQRHYKRFLLRLPEKIVAVKKIAAQKLQAAGEKTLTPI
jgi:hypothetical protein